MLTNNPLLVFLCALCGSLVLTYLVILLKIQDVPNARSSHQKTTPRSGGLSFVIIALLCLWFNPNVTSGVCFGLVLVAVVGFLDDVLGHIPASIRILVHVVAATLAVWGPVPNLLPLDIFSEAPFGSHQVFWVLWIVGAINITNFMDGIDGLAASHGSILFLFIGFSNPLGFVVAGGLLGFLIFNWPPAKIFMGDVGSGSLGFLLATSPLYLDSTSAVWIAGSLCFFWGDGVFTLLRRMVNGEKFWTPHRTHIYQLLTLRRSHLKITLGYSCYGLFCVLCMELGFEFIPFTMTPLIILILWMNLRRNI